MDWVIFGDDWNNHTSTTQHLIRNLPQKDKVVWVNSIGMRNPKINYSDFKRLVSKGLKLLFFNTENVDKQEDFKQIVILNPKVAPWHLNGLIALINKISLNHQIKKILKNNKIESPIILSANPVAINYINIRYRSLVYLRLDDYEKLPGVDPAIVISTESKMMNKADIIFSTAVPLLPKDDDYIKKSHYLPQGVNCNHFNIPLVVPKEKILGFFGILEKWIDYQLIENVANICPDWTLEFRGKIIYCPDKIRQLKNVRFLDAVPYEQLPDMITKWRAAWIPFEISRLTESVNPLKLREYLSAGLPTLSTPLPEAQSMKPWVNIVCDAADVKKSLYDIEQDDSVEKRTDRRREMQKHSWQARVKEMRSIIRG